VHLVQCKNKDCTAVATITLDDVDVHEALDAAGCVCCPLDHHHGSAANEPGAVPCRPVNILMVPGSTETRQAVN
jgi:hypothetical protein